MFWASTHWFLKEVTNVEIGYQRLLLGSGETDLSISNKIWSSHNPSQWLASVMLTKIETPSSNNHISWHLKLIRIRPVTISHITAFPVPVQVIEAHYFFTSPDHLSMVFRFRLLALWLPLGSFPASVLFWKDRKASMISASVGLKSTTLVEVVGKWIWNQVRDA